MHWLTQNEWAHLAAPITNILKAESLADVADLILNEDRVLQMVKKPNGVAEEVLEAVRYMQSVDINQEIYEYGTEIFDTSTFARLPLVNNTAFFQVLATKRICPSTRESSLVPAARNISHGRVEGGGKWQLWPHSHKPHLRLRGCDHRSFHLRTPYNTVRRYLGRPTSQEPVQGGVAGRYDSFQLQKHKGQLLQLEGTAFGRI